MITLQDILLYEQLRHKSFMAFDGKEDDMIALMYVHDHENRRNYTYKFYADFIHGQIKENKMPKEFRKFIAMANADLNYVNQFSKKDDEAKDDAPHEGEPPLLTPVINALLFQGGLEPTWLMAQGLDMLPVLTKGLEKKQQQEAENARFWNMLLVSPHLKRSDQQKLQHSLKFPWEKKEQQPEISESLNNKIARFIFGKSKGDDNNTIKNE